MTATNLSDLGDLVLTYIVTYGALALGAAVFAGAIGIPLPSSLFLIASGAFVQQGALDVGPTVMAAIGCVVLGDLASFGMGHALGDAARARFDHSNRWRRAEAEFARRGGAAIFLTRWLLTPIAIPVNLLAGGSRYPLWRFAGLSVAGETTWVLGYGALGYAFGSQWEVIGDFVNNFSGLLAGIVCVGVGLYVLWRRPGSG